MRAWPTRFFAAVVETPRRCELGEEDLAHEWRTLTGDGLLVLATRHGDVVAEWMNPAGGRSAHCAARASWPHGSSMDALRTDRGYDGRRP